MRTALTKRRKFLKTGDSLQVVTKIETSIKDALKKTNAHLQEYGLEHIDENPMVVKHWKSMVEQGYDAFIENHSVYVHKKCEGCESQFVIDGRSQGGCFLWTFMRQYKSKTQVDGGKSKAIHLQKDEENF